MKESNEKKDRIIDKIEKVVIGIAVIVLAFIYLEVLNIFMIYLSANTLELIIVSLIWSIVCGIAVIPIIKLLKNKREIQNPFSITY